MLVRRLVAAAGLVAATGLQALTPRPSWAQASPEKLDPAGLGLAGLPLAAWLIILALTLGLALSFFALLRLSRSKRDLALSRELFISLPQPRQLVDSKGHVHLANPAFERLFGETTRPAPELIAERCADDSIRDALTHLAEEARHGRPGSLDLPIRSDFWAVEASASQIWDGFARRSVHWCHVAAVPLGGRRDMVLWRVDEVDIEQALDRAMRAEQERLVELLEHAPIGFYAVDGDGRFLFANETLGDWLGIPPDALVSQPLRLHDVIASELLPGCEAHDPFGDGVSTRGEISLHGAGGYNFRAYVTQDLVKDEVGRVRRTRSVVRHLSQERAMADALARSERRFERVFEEAPVGIALIDGEARVTEYNAAMRELTADSGLLSSGCSLFDLVWAEDQAALRAYLEEVIAAPGSLPERPPVEVRLAGSEARVCAVFITRQELSAGAGSGFIVHFIDTTEQRSLEAQFAQSQKMQAVGQLAGGIAHDFNNLLTAMIGFSDLLLLRHRPGDQSFADIMQIKQNANRAANLVRQLLAFSRQQTLRPRVLDVTNILAELSHLLRRLIGENIELKMIHGRDLGSVKADQGQLEQVIINLAVNSRDAMPEGGQLTIRTDNVVLEREIKREGEVMPVGVYTCVVVTDTGHGISPENLDRIFEPFFSTKEVGAGTGLGLSTVYGIVKQSGGFVFAESEVGVGTTFSIYLPHHIAVEGEAAAGEAAAEESRDLSGIGTILLVEDEDGVRAFSARALRNKGYEVLEARSGEAALEQLNDRQRAIDLLITDVVMPKIDGPTLVREVREQRPNLKVIFISGYTEDAFRKRLDQDAGIHFLPKPFSLKQLAGKVKEVLREPQPGAGETPVAAAAVDAERASAG